MTISTEVCNSFKQELLAMTPHTAGDAYKLILIKASASRSYDKTQTNVGESGTPTGAGTPSSSLLGDDAIDSGNSTMGTYTVTGVTLLNFAVNLASNVAYATFDDPGAFTGTTISADGAMIYNSTRAGRAVAVFGFGGTITSTNGNFDVNLPANGYTTALIRIA